MRVEKRLELVYNRRSFDSVTLEETGEKMSTGDREKKMKKRLFMLLSMPAVLLLILVSRQFSLSAPLLDNSKIITSIDASISSPLNGIFSSPIWSKAGDCFLSGRSVIVIKNSELEEKEEVSLDPSLSPFGFTPEKGTIVALREEEGNNDICLFDIHRKTYGVVRLPVRKSWRKIRILDPGLTPGGEIIAVFQRESDDRNVKECYVFTMNATGKAFRQLTDNSIYLIKTKFLFIGKKEAYGKLRFPVMSFNGKSLAFLSLVDPDPGKVIYNLCVQAADKGSPRILVPNLSHPGPPSWTPDGSRLAIKSVDESGQVKVLVVTMEGKGEAVIPAGSVKDIEDRNLDGVSWSFDGEWIAYTGDGGRKIEVSSTNGATRMTVAQIKVPDEQKSSETLISPRWSPSALNLAYVQHSIHRNEIPSFLYLARITR